MLSTSWRPVVALLLTAPLLAGCLGADESVDPASNEGLGDRLDREPGEIVDEVDNATETYVAFQRVFEGRLPDPNAQIGLIHEWPFPVVEDAVEIVVVYTVTYTGNHPPILFLYDAKDERAANSREEGCGAIEPAVNKKLECTIRLSKGLGAGDWSVVVANQLGLTVVADYSADTTVLALRGPAAEAPAEA
ncbi:MAG TPA: hypothetical protein VM681_03820 [Candidatus Thermoplasmatota archaeon]|nr:hypothetical protein [Candidatus Thermoplasmatota archaeon]